ncbi:hypothetical protein [Dyella amyloliquefaciens]|uniref:hypothetical protein n=1 Tax=Dyella amyloliquefaciens TaxID=1770545 RepID=UPI00102ECBF0|nr:hypothetical protein [Dyella amyloliquefaciens]
MKALLAAWLLFAAVAGPSAPVQCLVDSTATDFHLHGAQGAVQFRDVRLGHVGTPGGSRQYFLCGEFSRSSSQGKAESGPFITIKTSGHETWLGEQARSMCERASNQWDKSGPELSSVLQQRFDAGQSAR